MWEGDPRAILETIYKYYFSRIYMGSRNSRRGLKYYKNVYNILLEKIKDIETGIIVTKEELSNGKIPTELIPKDIQEEIVESITGMHLYNELRMNEDIVEFLPVVSKILVIKNEKIKNVYYGENKLIPDHSELAEFKLKYFGKEPKSIHAEVDAMFKVWQKYNNNNCEDCNLIIITVRNGHNILSRPCKFCRGMLNKVLSEMKFKRIFLVYPIIDDLIMIEEFKPKSL